MDEPENYLRAGGFLRMNGSAGAFLRGGATPLGAPGCCGAAGVAGPGFEVNFVAVFASKRAERSTDLSAGLGLGTSF